MIYMQLKNIKKSFSGINLFHQINLDIKNNDRVAVVGRNGTGKSTLLKIMTTEIDYDEGEMFQAKNITIGYLAQLKAVASQLTIWEELIAVFAELIEEENELKKLAQTIGYHASNGIDNEQLILTYGEKQEAFEARGGYRYESDLKGILIGLGFSESDFSRQISELSGGQKTRLALGKLLLQQPDVLILDEPTNHLDIDTLTWLENYLKNYEGALVLVSHDRYFLDKLVSVVYEISHSEGKKYTGSYTHYLQQKAINYEQDMKRFTKQQQEIKQMEDFVQRNIARASTTKRAQSRRKQLEKMERVDRPLGVESSASFSFQIEKSSGNDVLSVNHLSLSFNDHQPPLFSDVTFQLLKGERVALVGKNGVGKTTLLNSILREVNGVIVGTNVTIGYFDQEQMNLNEKNNILEEVWQQFPLKNEQEIRTVLGNFLFTKDDVLKVIHTLSGGEKARVALAKLMLLKANFLLLDEPTNHLDIVSKEILEAALLEYPGTILFISHDRYFINKIADKVMELQTNGITEYLGDFDYYIAKKWEQKERKKLEKTKELDDVVNHTTNKTNNQLSFTEQKNRDRERRKTTRDIQLVESEIELLEEDLSEYEKAINDEVNMNDYIKIAELTNEMEQIKKTLDDLFDQWEALHE